MHSSYKLTCITNWIYRSLTTPQGHPVRYKPHATTEQADNKKKIERKVRVEGYANF